MNRGEEYDMLKEQISNEMLKIVYNNVNGSKEALDYIELSTPLSVMNLANYQQGELYGINHNPIRFHQKWLRPKTNYKNFFLTGQDILTVGVTSAMFSGLLTASLILNKNLIKKIIKS